MAVQLSVAVRNARLDTVESTIGASAVLRIRTGDQPANCAAARTGAVLSTVNLPADWLAAASSGQKAIAGTWQDLSADATGEAGHFEIMDNGLTTCHMQGSVAASGSPDMTVSTVDFEAGQTFNVTQFTLTDPNA